MPRGRRSAAGAGSRDSPAPPKDSGSPSGRLTRSSSSRRPNASGSDLDFAKTPTPATITPSARRARGRPSRASLLASHEPAIPSPSGIANAGTLRRGRSSRMSATGSESVTSIPSPDDKSSADELSTPATSKMPTPVAGESRTSLKPQKIMAALEVQLPGRTRLQVTDSERALRSSMYSINSTSKHMEIGDTDDDDFSDQSLGAITARRLHAAEVEKVAGKKTQSPFRRSTRQAATASFTPSRNEPTLKRNRSATDSSVKKAPPAKKSRVVPDSDDSSDMALDMDAEVAAAVALEPDDQSDLSDFGDEHSIADSSAVSESEISDTDSEDEPLSSMRRAKPIKRPSVATSAAKSSNAQQPTSRPYKMAKSRTAAPGSDVNRYDGGDGGDADAPVEPAESESTPISSAFSSDLSSAASSDGEAGGGTGEVRRITSQRRAFRRTGNNSRLRRERSRLEHHHPEILSMWQELKDMPPLKAGVAQQPQTISRQMKPFQLEGLAWMKEMEKTEWKGGLLGDEMGLGKTIQAVSLIMSDYPAKQPSLVLVPPVALMQWQSEIKSYTDGTLKTFVFHGTNQKAKGITVKDLKRYDVIMMSYNSLESMYRKQEKGFKRKDGIYKERSVIHSIQFHRVILDEAHCIKTRTTMTAKACFALKTDYRWCLTGTPLQNRIGEFFSLIRFLNIQPFASYLCKQCPCSSLEWTMNDNNRCRGCNHAGMQHISVFNQELLNPIQKFGNFGPGREAFGKLRLMTDRIMLRRLKKDHTNAMELPVKEIYVDRQFFGEEENDFANSIMTNGQRKFDTYVAQGVLLNNYANIFGLIMQMRQVADHPDLILKKNAEGGQNVLVCCICDEPAEDTVRSRCKHDFCRACVASYVRSTDEPDCPRCHIPLSIDLEQPEIEQDETMVKKSSIINRIKMENWTSSSKIELLVHELHKLRSDNASHKSIIFSQFTTMLQLIEWRLRRAGITTVMLDGSMTPAQRQASIEHFMNNVDVECFLVSLKAGGVALNLTEASRVFIVDPWWNPAAEWQSADRCHRIGQTRPCTITRLCIEDSVESRMVLIQEKKTSMIHSTVNADDKAMESLTPQDMQFLFRGS
ncbi:hypothetical protein HIM_05485 [Hirsutella minnesotensis 3608]|uniref:DNA repair protein RAD16 n=1 Tax=Hirsutella minnesotensis 3608 TaxID=1043627 RepID=A0A0F8A5A7_9HYPO|nr:hypothetical protein HIM_05485 [Hirsutella minnesotensis 3608]